jgi:hypothetical protein
VEDTLIGAVYLGLGSLFLFCGKRFFKVLMFVLGFMSAAGSTLGALAVLDHLCAGRFQPLRSFLTEICLCQACSRHEIEGFQPLRSFLTEICLCQACSRHEISFPTSAVLFD